MEFNATLLVAMISFGIFIVIMNAIFYKPIFKIINERKDFIDSSLSDAENSKIKAENLLKDKDEKLKGAKKKSIQIVQKSLEAASNKSEEQIVNAKQFSRQQILKAKQSLETQSGQIKQELEDKSKYLADEITAKIMGEV